MSTHEHKDLIRIATYPVYEEAEIARSFLLHRGVTGVVVLDQSASIEDQADLAFAAGLFDLLVPPADAAKAVMLLGEEWRLEADTAVVVEAPFASELPDELNVEPL
jgi:hypothetical protein